METVSQREMRNNSGELLRRVAAGESVLVTNNGLPAAVLVPVTVGVRDRLISTGRLKVGTGLNLDLLPSPRVIAQQVQKLIDEDRDR